MLNRNNKIFTICLGRPNRFYFLPSIFQAFEQVELIMIVVNYQFFQVTYNSGYHTCQLSKGNFMELGYFLQAFMELMEELDLSNIIRDWRKGRRRSIRAPGAWSRRMIRILDGLLLCQFSFLCCIWNSRAVEFYLR